MVDLYSCPYSMSMHELMPGLFTLLDDPIQHPDMTRGPMSLGIPVQQMNRVVTLTLGTSLNIKQYSTIGVWNQCGSVSTEFVDNIIMNRHTSTLQNVLSLRPLLMRAILLSTQFSWALRHNEVTRSNYIGNRCFSHPWYIHTHANMVSPTPLFQLIGDKKTKMCPTLANLV